MQLLKNKVKICMDAQRRWWVNVLRTDVNGHILDRVDSANERKYVFVDFIILHLNLKFSRIENYNRSTGAGRSTSSSPTSVGTGFSPVGSIRNRRRSTWWSTPSTMCGPKAAK